MKKRLSSILPLVVVIILIGGGLLLGSMVNQNDFVEEKLEHAEKALASLEDARGLAQKGIRLSVRDYRDFDSVNVAMKDLQAKIAQAEEAIHHAAEVEYDSTSHPLISGNESLVSHIEINVGYSDPFYQALQYGNYDKVEAAGDNLDRELSRWKSRVQEYVDALKLSR